MGEVAEGAINHSPQMRLELKIANPKLAMAGLSGNCNTCAVRYSFYRESALVGFFSADSGSVRRTCTVSKDSRGVFATALASPFP